MVASLTRQRLKLPFAAIAALGTGCAVSAGVALIPRATLELLVVQSGVATLVAAAEPPLGATARLLIALSAGAAVALVAWCVLILATGVSRVRARARHIDAASVPARRQVRRSDAHPDAPPREPLLATRDLGTPFLEIRASEPAVRAARPQPEPLPIMPEPPSFAPGGAATAPAPAPLREPSPEPRFAERPLPADWSQPMAAFDPAAIPETPLEPPVQPARLRKALKPKLFNPYERLETFELEPPIPRVAPPASSSEPVRAVPLAEAEPIAAPDTDATIHALLARLERGVERRGFDSIARPSNDESQPRGLQEALVSLRNMAMRA